MPNTKVNKFGEDSLMPRNDELERQVLGEILVAGNNAYEEIEGILSPSSFYSDLNATIYSAFSTIVTERRQISPLEVSQVLRREGKLEYIGGPSYLISLSSNIASTSYLPQHAIELRQCEIQRGLFIYGEKIKMMACDDTYEVAETIEFADKTLTEMQINSKGEVHDINDSLTRYYEWAISNSENKQGVISSGLCGLDNILDGGFRAPDLIVVGGRPSMGKTALAVQFAENFIRAGRHVLFFSLEMTDIQLIGRMVAKNGVQSSHVRRGTMSPLEWQQQEMNMTSLQGLRLHIADSEDHKQLSSIKSESYRFKRRGELDVIIIDYLQYIRTRQRFEKRYLEVGFITSELKSLAKELNVPIILLAQLGRKTDSDEDQTPKMEDLRESGNIEQDADVIIFPHRPWVYNNLAVDQTGRSWKDRGVLYVAKNREGMRNVKTYFMTDSQFKEFSDDEVANEVLPHE